MWVNPNRQKDFNLADKIGLEDYLGIRGAHVVTTGHGSIERGMLSKSERALVNKLAKAAGVNSAGFNVLNRLATRV